MEAKKYSLIVTGSTLRVSVDGMMKAEDHTAFMEDYQKTIHSMPSKKRVEVDCSNMKTVMPDMRIAIIGLLKLYKQSFDKIAVIMPTNSVTTKMQITKTAQEAGIDFEVM